MSIKDQLLENIKEFVKEAEKAQKDEAYNSAVTLVFKAMAVLTDLFILEKEGFIPSNHTQRFEILRKKYGEIYQIIDKCFPLYQQTYRIKVGKQNFEVIENDFRRLVKISGIDISV